jgi:hypothetical protein
VANLIAQTEALAFGRDRPDEPHRSCAGNRPPRSWPTRSHPRYSVS